MFSNLNISFCEHLMLASLILFITLNARRKYEAGTTVNINDIIEVVGDGYSTDSYKVNFLVGSDTAFHFNPRFGEGAVVRNSNIGGSWGVEERGGGMQLSANANDSILLEFNRTATHWRFFSFHSPIPDYDYAHRLNGNITNIKTANIINASIYIHCPTQCPTPMPSASPTTDPTNNPTSYPTFDPTENPTNDPTNATTTDPSADPTFYLSVDPSAHPTIYPTADPTKPTLHPTKNPTFSPTTPSPSAPPTDSPSLSPTASPTKGPSRYPTAFEEYDSFFRITYSLKNLEDEYILILVNNIIYISDDIIEIIEQSYFETTALKYRFFSLQIEDLLGYTIKKINNEKYAQFANAQKYGISINSKIECSDYSCLILSDYDNLQDKFELIATHKLRKYFVDYKYSDMNAENEETESKLIFEIQSYGKISALYPSETSEITVGDNKLLIVLFTVLATSFIISLLAFIDSKTTHIDCIWQGLMLYALQWVLMASDINVCFTIMFDDEFRTDLRIYLCGIACIVFICMPYCVNAVCGYRIVSIMQKSNIVNENAILFFRKNSKFVMVLIMICGGCYPVLVLLSSGIFGLQLFNSGLLNYELKKWNKIKIIATICLQNIPQIFIQCIYTASIDRVSSVVVFAFLISILSIICTPFTIKPDINVTHSAYNYYLEIKAIDDNEADVNKKGIVANKGKTHEMGLILCDVFDCHHTNIQISRNSTVNPSILSASASIILCVVHFVKCMDINDIIKLYAAKHRVLRNRFEKHFDLNGECMIYITFRSSGGEHEIVRILDLDMDKSQKTFTSVGCEMNEGLNINSIELQVMAKPIDDNVSIQNMHIIDIVNEKSERESTTSRDDSSEFESDIYCHV